MKRRLIASFAAGIAAIVALAGCGGTTPTDTDEGPSTDSNQSSAANGEGKEITLWLIGGDTPDELRTYLKTEFNKKTGADLKIEEQSWGDVVTKLTTAMPDEANTPDVTEIGNTQSPTFTNVGAFLDLTDMYEELGGENLLQSFVEVGKVGDQNFTLPYYFGSRYMFYRKDIWDAAGQKMPTTLDEFNKAVIEITKKNPENINDFSGFFLGGQDWRDGISWIFANGGEIAVEEGGEWKATLDSPESLKGLEQLQDLYQNASNAPNDMKDANQYQYINDTDSVESEDKSTTDISIAAATIMAPGWAHWSIGDLDKDDEGKDVRVWNDDIFGTMVLPGNDGKPAPVFAGGSNIGISAKTQEPELSKELMRIIFSEEYQNMLGENGLGPGDSRYASSLGDDQFAQALIESASNSKLTPAAPGWAGVESANVMEEFFSKIRDAKDLSALAKEYNAKLDALLNE